jgi:hypothetical protein
VHGLVALFLEVIALAVFLLFVGLVTHTILVITTRMIMALIVLMTIVGLFVVAITLATSMIVAVLVATMLLVAQFMAAHDWKMSRLLLFWLLLVLGNLLKNAGCFISSMTLLKKGDELKQVCGHHLVQVRKLKLMRLGLHKEDLFTLLLRRGQLHHSSEGATTKVADKLCLMNSCIGMGAGFLVV